jgi:hypothetical protein
VNSSALLKCLHLEALDVRVSLWDLLVTLGGCHHLDGLCSEDRRVEVGDCLWLRSW